MEQRKRSVNEADAQREKKLRVEVPKVNLTGWRTKTFFQVSFGGAVTCGHLREEVIHRFEEQELRGTLPKYLRSGFGISSQDLQDARVELFRPELLFSIEGMPKVKDGTGYLEATRGKTISGLEDRFRERVKKCYCRDHRVNLFLDMLDKTAVAREKDNLYHLYALYMHYPRISSEMEHLFLWLATGSGVNNKHGIWIKPEQVQMLCSLLEAESVFGVPVLTDDDPGKFKRYERLDLTHIIADMIEALATQHYKRVFARPLAWSLHVQDGYQNVVKLELGKVFGIKDITGPNYVPK